MGERRAEWFSDYRAALAQRDLRLLLGALLISMSGSWAYNVALLAFVFDRTHSLGWVGAAGLVRYVPALLLSPYGGVLAERTDRVRLMLSADLLCALWQSGLVLVAALSGPVVLALALSALTAISSVVYSPAVSATIPSLVGEDELVAANALNSTIENLVVILGPAVGAVLLLAGSTSIVFALDAVSYLLSALLLSRVRTSTRPVDVTESGTAGPLAQMSVGVRTILTLPAARTLVAFCALVSLLYGTDTVLLIDVSSSRLGLGPEGFGYLLAGLGLGGVLMAAAVNRLAGSARLANIILAGVAGYCLPTALLVFIHSPALAFATEVFRGGATLVVDVLAVTALQRAVPADSLARVFGVFFAFILGAISLGVIITPPIVHALGLDGALIAMAVGPLVLALMGYPALLSIDRHTARRAQELAPRVAVLEGLGIFATASRAVLERLVGEAREIEFPPGGAIVTEGERADAVYVLVDGEVRVTGRGEQEGPERLLRVITGPAYFGEIGVLGHIPRTATVTAVSACRCERIEGQALLDALNSTPPSSTLMENARSHLALTHPSQEPVFATIAQ